MKRTQLGEGRNKSSRLTPSKRFIIGITLSFAAIAGLPLGVYAVQNIFTGFGQVTDIQYAGAGIDQVVYQGETIWERACDQPNQSFNYTGGVQTFTANCGGYYQIELWGASGDTSYYAGKDGKGAYTKGTIYLAANSTLYVYVGQKAASTRVGGWNGGGNGSTVQGSGGGGATDIRLSSGSWNDVNGLRSRIMVAAGGGGSSGWPSNATTGAGGHGGGLIGMNGSIGPTGGGGLVPTTGGTQIAGGTAPTNNTDRPGNPGSFGIGGNGTTVGSPYGGGAGGGYYGGGGGGCNSPAVQAGAGGSSYISGHTGAVAITSASNQAPKSGCTTGTADNNCSMHYSGNIFTKTKMINGAGYNWTNTQGALEPMPNPVGGTYASGAGHIGNGAAKITYLGTNSQP